MVLECKVAMEFLDNSAVTVSCSNGVPGKPNTTMCQVNLDCLDNIMPLCVRQKWMAWII
jgi:hypothetical protein